MNDLLSIGNDAINAAERKVTISIKTSPEELRVIALHLETNKKVRVNWYHTRYEFINDA